MRREKVVCASQQNLLRPLIPVGCRDVWDLVILQKTMTDFSIDFERTCSFGAIKKSTFRDIVRALDFRLFNKIGPQLTSDQAKGQKVLSWRSGTLFGSKVCGFPKAVRLPGPPKGICNGAGVGDLRILRFSEIGTIFPA